MNNKICLYCEGRFKDWHSLKEHMRKKLHKILNPYNKEYDEFYLINYLKTNTKWFKSKANRNELDDEKEDTFDDWIETASQEQLECLLCNFKLLNLDEFKDHLLAVHLFDFNNLDQYSFYKKVQIINYIRSRIRKMKCLNCDDHTFESLNELNQHLLNENHNRLPLKEQWNSNEFYQPVIGNDLLLRLIDADDLNDDLENKLVIPE